MSTLELLDSAIKVGKELEVQSSNCKILSTITQKLSRKVNRGNLITKDLKETVSNSQKSIHNKEETKDDKRTRLIIKNYLSILESSLEFIKALDSKYQLTAILNSDNHKKALYSILNELEQAIFELDTEACLIERKTFEKYKLDLQNKRREEELYDQAANKFLNGNNELDKLEVNEGKKLDLDSKFSVADEPKIILSQPTSDTTDTTTDNKPIPPKQLPQIPATSKVDPVQELDSSLSNMVISQPSQPQPQPQPPQLHAAVQVDSPNQEFQEFLQTHYIPRELLSYDTSLVSQKSALFRITKRFISFSPSIQDHVVEKTYRADLPNILQLILREITNLHTLQGSPYIVRLYGITHSESLPNFYNYATLIESTQRGSLSDFIYQGLGLDDGTKLNLMEDLAHGLAYLHNTHQYIHRNLNSANILVNEHGRAKITGFEYAISIRKATVDFSINFQESCTDDTKPFSTVSALRWLDPYLVKFPKHPFSTKADIYAFGMIFWSTFSERTPFAKRSLEDLISNHRTDGRESKTKIPIAYHHLLDKCWETELEKRPNIDEVLQLLSEPSHEIVPEQQFHMQPSFLRAPSPSPFLMQQQYQPNYYTDPYYQHNSGNSVGMEIPHFISPSLQNQLLSPTFPQHHPSYSNQGLGSGFVGGLQSPDFNQSHLSPANSLSQPTSPTYPTNSTTLNFPNPHNINPNYNYNFTNEPSVYQPPLPPPNDRPGYYSVPNPVINFLPNQPSPNNFNTNVHMDRKGSKPPLPPRNNSNSVPPQLPPRR